MTAPREVITGQSFRWILVIVSLLTVLLFALTNLPWTLDDYDQAKQAFVSDQIVKQGRWFYQTTPQEGLGSGLRRHTSHHLSTKPPGVAWVSAALFMVTRSWDLAWRLPSFLAALGLGWMIFRTALRAWGREEGLLALAAFGLNLLAVRLATLVRTDMPLALVTFAIGLLLFEKVRTGIDWRRDDRWRLFLLLTAGMFVKGPIVYAFVLPALVIYQWRRRRSSDWPTAWSGWLPWVGSLAVFLLWVIVGIKEIPGFYEDVVLTEFAGRFHEGVHRSQPVWFYLPHLLQKWAPWSLLLLLLAWNWARKRERPLLSPAMFWLVSWALGGVVIMSLLPSKRVDRIFPAIPPLCLLLASQCGRRLKEGGSWLANGRLLTGTLIAGVLFTTGYAVLRMAEGYRHDRAALERFGREIRALASREHIRYEVAPTDDEGLLLYLQRPKFVSPNDRAQPDLAWIKPTKDSAAAARLIVEKKTDPPARYGFFTPAPVK